MKLTLLVENNSLYDTFFHAEHGFSAYIQDAGKKILYDTGYSNAFIKNAEQMGIDLTQLDYIIVSHGHYDHSGGVKHLMKYYEDKNVKTKPVFLIASEDFFLEKYNFEVKRNTGFTLKRSEVEKYFTVRVEPKPLFLTENVIYLGQVERLNKYECQYPQNKKMKNGEWVNDYISEDTQIAFKHKNNEVSVITGCSHNGICNIIAYAKKIANAKQVNTVLGGFHLQSPSDELLDFTINYILNEKIPNFYPCHDVDFESKLAMAKAGKIKETGVSLTLDFD